MILPPFLDPPPPQSNLIQKPMNPMIYLSFSKFTHSIFYSLCWYYTSPHTMYLWIYDHVHWGHLPLLLKHQHTSRGIWPHCIPTYLYKFPSSKYWPQWYYIHNLLIYCDWRPCDRGNVADLGLCSVSSTILFIPWCLTIFFTILWDIVILYVKNHLGLIWEHCK